MRPRWPLPHARADPALTRASAPWGSYTCLAASMALVGCYVALSKALIVALPLFLLAFLRFGIAALAMVPWLRRGPLDAPLDRRAHRLLFLESFFGNFLFSLCMLAGIARTTALAAGVIMAGIPAAVALLSRLLLDERIAGRTLAGIGFAVGGIAWVSIAHRAVANAAPASLAGNLLLVGAVFCEATYVVIGKRLAAVVGPKRISALINLWGLALVAPLGLWQAARFDFSSVAPGSWALLLFYALSASVATVWLWMTGLKRVPASRAGVFTALLPTSAAAVGVLFLNETIEPAEAVAFALASTGVLLATWPSRA